MFKRIVLENFRAFGHFELDLSEKKTEKKAKRFVLIYGENGIGKSSIIDAVSFLKDSSHSLIDLFGFNKSFQVERDDDWAKSPLLSKFLDEKLKTFTLPHYGEELGRIDSEAPTKVEYHGVLREGKTFFSYALSFDRSGGLTEELRLDEEVVLSINKETKMPYLSEKDITSPQLRESILKCVPPYYGGHSLLSCFTYSIKNMEADFVKSSLSKRLLSFLLMLGKIEIYKPGNSISRDLYSYNRNPQLLPHLFHGAYNDFFIERKDHTITVLSAFLQSLSNNVVGVDYKITDSDDGNKEYTLMLKRRSENGKTLSVPYGLESTGTQNLLALFTFLFEAASNDSIVLIDEIDTGINDILLRAVIHSLSKSVKGQFIATTHNTLLLSYSLKSGCYLLNRLPDGSIESYSLDTFGRSIQEKTDVVGRYLRGLYGGVPAIGNFSIAEIVELLQPSPKK